MENEQYISIRQICTSYNIEPSFLTALEEFGIIEIIHEGDEDHIDHETLSSVETMIRLHYDLDINMEGLDAISQLLNKIQDMQNELNRLRNRML